MQKSAKRGEIMLGLITLYEWSRPDEMIDTTQFGVITCLEWMKREQERLAANPQRSVFLRKHSVFNRYTIIVDDLRTEDEIKSARKELAAEKRARGKKRVMEVKC